MTCRTCPNDGPWGCQGCPGRYYQPKTETA